MEQVIINLLLKTNNMKKYNAKSTLSQKVITKKYSELHVEKNNSVTVTLERKNQTSTSVISVDDSVTNITDGSFSIIIQYLYEFLLNELPEEEDVTKWRISFLEYIIDTSNNSIGTGGEILDAFYSDGYYMFFINFVGGKYKEIIFDYKKNVDSYLNMNFDNQQIFTLLIKDGNNVSFSAIKSAKRSDIKVNSSPVIRCPMSDSQTSNKDGFVSNEPFFIFYKNEHTNIEIPIIVVATPNLLAGDKKEIIIQSMTLSDESKFNYNPFLYQSVLNLNNFVL